MFSIIIQKINGNIYMDFNFQDTQFKKKKKNSHYLNFYLSKVGVVPIVLDNRDFTVCSYYLTMTPILRNKRVPIR